MNLNRFRCVLPCGLILLSGAAGRAQVVIGPGGAPSTAVISQTDGVTTVNLSGPSRLEWSQFNVGAGQSLKYVSGSTGHTSLNVVRGAAPASIHGAVTADGPFYLISPSGIQIGRAGSVSAPQILLSALGTAQDLQVLSGGVAAFSKQGTGMVTVDGLLTAGNGGSVVVMGTSVRTGPTARIQAPGGRVQVVAADGAAVTGSVSGGMSLGVGGAAGAGLVNQEGTIEARQVHVLSDGFLRNGGRLISSGPGNEVRLSAPQVTHELRPDGRSVISTGQLVVQGNFRQDGPVVNPDDGANPAPVAGVRLTPRLSTRGVITSISPGQTQLASSPLQKVLPAVSPIPADRRKPALVAARGTEAGKSKEPDKEKPAAVPAAAAKAGGVRKASFFGQTVKP